MRISTDSEQMAVGPGKSPAQQRLRQLQQQLQLLSPGELRLLQSEINHSLQCHNDELLTQEELNLISSLF